MERVVIYPGTFDPVTHGHMDVLKQAVMLFDQVIVCIAYNIKKTPCFPVEKRVELMQHAIAELPRSMQKCIKIKPHDGLMVKFASDHNACAIIRGLRAVSDFEYEFQMAGVNNKLNSHIKHVCLMATGDQQFISSSFVREVASVGGDVSSFVCSAVNQAMMQINQKGRIQ